MPRLLPLLLIGLLAFPSASAGWFDRDEAVTITVAESRVGERTAWTFDTSYREELDDPTFTPQSEVSGERLVVIEGPGRAADAYGIERATVSRLVQTTTSDGSASQVRLHCLAGSDENVRAEHLAGGATGGGSESSQLSSGWLEIYSSRSSYDVSSLATFPRGKCALAPNGTTHAEGEVLTLGALTGISDPAWGADVVSAPAVATTFHGRDALLYVFDQAEIERATGSARGASGTQTFLLADGLPGIVKMTRASTWPRGYLHANSTLAGIEAGTGDPIGRAGSGLPERNPNAEFLDPQTTFDDSGLQLRFPFARALEIASLDPQGAGAWLAAHPNAYLHQASYIADFGTVDNLRPDTWILSWTDDASAYVVMVQESGGVETPAGAFDWPARLPQPGKGNEVERGPAEWPAGGIVDGATISRIALREGISPGATRSLSYMVYGEWSTLVLSEAPSDESGGRVLGIDLVTGATTFVGVMSAERTEKSGLLALAPVSGGLAGERSDAPALSALAGPVDGLALPAAATGVALLLIVGKFLLVPLFTRLRRASLLDNPTRARVYERVREHPGIHLAALCDHVGLSESATRHHVEQLVKHRYVVELDVDELRRYYAAGELAPEDARRAAVLRSEPTRAVYEFYRADPEASLREAARRLGTSAPGVHRIRKRLEREGLLPARR